MRPLLRPPDQRERRADQQAGRARHRRQVQAVGLRDRPVADVPELVGHLATVGREVAAGHEQEACRDGDADCDEQQPPAQVGHPPLSPGADQQRHHDRPEQVELLLHGEAPEVAKRREGACCGVPLAHPDLVPVGHVAEPGENIAAQPGQFVAFPDPRVRDQQDEHEEQRRQQASRAASPELPQADPARSLVLTDEQQRDQVAADHEEDLDAEEPTRQPLVVGVVHHHRDDGERAHPVEARQVGHARQRPPAAVPARVTRWEAPARAAACSPVLAHGSRVSSYETPRPRLAQISRVAVDRFIV